MPNKVLHRSTAAVSWVHGSNYKPRYPSVYNGPCTHGTGLQGDIEGAVHKPPASKIIAGFLYCHYLSVGCWILFRLPSVVALSYNLALVYNNSTHWYFVGAGLGNFQCYFHVFFVHFRSPSNKWCTREESNPCSCLRRAPLYPSELRVQVTKIFYNYFSPLSNILDNF